MMHAATVLATRILCALRLRIDEAHRTILQNRCLLERDTLEMSWARARLAAGMSPELSGQDGMPQAGEPGHAAFCDLMDNEATLEWLHRTRPAAWAA